MPNESAFVRFNTHTSTEEIVYASKYVNALTFLSPSFLWSILLHVGLFFSVFCFCLAFYCKLRFFSVRSPLIIMLKCRDCIARDRNTLV